MTPPPSRPQQQNIYTMNKNEALLLNEKPENKRWEDINYSDSILISA